MYDLAYQQLTGLREYNVFSDANYCHKVCDEYWYHKNVDRSYKVQVDIDISMTKMLTACNILCKFSHWKILWALKSIGF